MAVTAVAILKKWMMGTRTKFVPYVNILEYEGGKETRTKLSGRQRWVLNGNTDRITIALAKTIRALSNQQFGPAIAFLAEDPVDSSGTDEPLGTGDGSTATFQIIKRYEEGGGTPYDHTIRRPTSGTVVVKVDDVTQTEGTDYTIDYTTGVITFTTAPADTLAVTASYDFLYPCRFAEEADIEWHSTFAIAHVELMEVFE